MNKIKNKKLTSGFTAMEIIIVIAISTIIMLAVSTFQRDVIVHNSMIQSGAIAEEGMRNTLKQILSELRGVSSSQTGAYGLESVATNTIIFYSDIDSDDVRERVRYFLDNQTFKKGVVEPTGQPYTYNLSAEQLRIVADNVINGTSSVFSFYDNSYTGTSSALSLPTDISKIKLIKINLGLDPNPNRPLEAMWITSQVMLRNFKGSL